MRRIVLLILILGSLCLLACNGETPDANEPTRAISETPLLSVEPTIVPVLDELPLLIPENAREESITVTSQEDYGPTWVREPNEQEQAIARGEVVRIESGSEVYLDADGVRERIVLGCKSTQEGVTFSLTCGDVTIAGGRDEASDIGAVMLEPVQDIYAVKLQGTKSSGFGDYVQLLIPTKNDAMGSVWNRYMVFAYDRVYGAETLMYLGTLVLYGGVEDLTILEDGFSITKEIPFAGTEASVLVRQKTTLCSGMTGDDERAMTHVLCEVPKGMYALQSICTTDKDIYVYSYGSWEPIAILPAGSAIACSATDGGGWFYFEFCDAYESGWFFVEELDGVAYVAAPEDVTVTEAGLFWDNP